MSETNASLLELATLCKQLRDAESEVASLEEHLKVVKATVRRMTEDDIPDFMSELGLKEIKLASGETVKISDDIFIQPLAADKEKIYLWLEENGYGSIIKTEVAIQFGTLEIEKALALAERLRDEENLTPEITRGVHASTMKAWMKEKLAKEAEQFMNQEEVTSPVPLELFGARPFSKAVIKLPKNAS